MALRQILSNILLPNLERDLSRSVTSQLATVHNMTDTMLAPHVYCFESAATTSMRGFAKTGARAAPARMVKVEYPAPKGGLFD